MKQESDWDELEQHEDESGILTLLLNRPGRKNALSRGLVLVLGEVLEALASRHDLRAVVLAGRGGSFCSGADLTTITEAEDVELESRVDEFHRLIRSIVNAPQPVIAAVEGPAVGFGADLCLCCDMRVFSETAFIQESFVRIGLMPDGGGSYWMDKFLGPRAFEVLARGTRLTASECKQWGIANLVVDGGQALTEASAWAADCARSAPLALRAIKRATRLRDRSALERTLELEKAGQVELLRSADFREGVAAFLQKRTPSFRGE